MVRRIVWVLQAQKDRIQILSYWKNRNKSITFSRKLERLFRESLDIVCKYPFIGKPTDIPNVRIKIVVKYLLIYEITDNEIIVLRIWDSRRNPVELGF
jgi:toxin YoeB